MASTNFTTHFEIPLPLGSDLTTPMDYNSSMEAVDTALFQAQTDSEQAAELAGQANDTANTAASAADDVAADLTLEKAKIVALQTRMTNAENEIDDVRADVQDSICAYNEPTATSTHHYNVDDFFFYNNTLYVATAEINIGDTITPNTNCDTTTITAELLKINSNLTTVTRTVLHEATTAEPYSVVKIDNGKLHSLNIEWTALTLNVGDTVLATIATDIPSDTIRSATENANEFVYVTPTGAIGIYNSAGGASTGFSNIVYIA